MLANVKASHSLGIDVEEGEREDAMADKLTELYHAEFPADDMGGFAYFQRGFSKSAQSMRQRAMDLVQKLAQKPSVLKQSDVNDVVNAIGSLADIPE